MKFIYLTFYELVLLVRYLPPAGGGGAEAFLRDELTSFERQIRKFHCHCNGSTVRVRATVKATAAARVRVTVRATPT